ncbi:MAG TPA: choice-of-anchor V domain-containing protein [Bryobacteraceae bacterium]|nr:choice-of-anchor V domain-containing protein [Bryobacteraceae bacterium]
MRILAFLLACSTAPVVLHAHVDGTPVGYAGVPTDHGGATCASCHTGGPPVNAAGRFSLIVTNFSPGIQQNIAVEISDSGGRLFAFQLTARLASHQTMPAGTFLPTPGQTQVLCANGQPGPCAGGVEYVTNLAAAAQPQTPGTRTFTITWNPPGTDVGPVLFYVSAIAANGDGTPLGDHVYGASGQAVSAAPCSLTGTPAFNTQGAIEDAAASHNTIASYGLFRINGSGFFAAGAPGYVAAVTDLDSNGNWPTELGCVSVLINGTAAPVYYVSDQEIRAQAINFLASEGADVQVILNPGLPNQIKGPVSTASAAPLAPTLFTFNAAGTGNAAAFDATRNADLADTSVMATGVKASEGDLIELFGTGFGAVAGYLPGQFALTLAPVTNPFSVTIGGVKVPDNDILYVGLAPDPTRQENAPGLYAVVVRVPQVPAGDQTVFVTVGSASTQGQVTIPIQ